MNFITFAAQYTNIFPASNSTLGGQLMTEWNIKSRESVMTDPHVSYSVGPSFVHGEKDFEVQLWTDEGGGIINNSTLRIAEGRGVINGHYVETLAPMYIDLIEANVKLAAQSRPVLKGSLAVGIRTFFATDQTVAGTILVESRADDDPERNVNKDMFIGIQMVVLPEDELITPLDSPDDPNKVTADIRLAKFKFYNNAIQNLQNLNESKLQYISSDRITDLSNVVSSKYVTKIGLNSKKLYVFAGKGVNPETGADTWEDATDSMFVWDAEPTRTTAKPAEKEAFFTTYTNETNEFNATYLVLPHKQVEGMTTDQGEPEYYESKLLKIPSADYTNSTSGVVTKAYTDQIKSLAQTVYNFQYGIAGTHGKQVYYIPIRTVATDLPPIQSVWNYGDYILVGSDEYYAGGPGDTSSPPATIYVVLPGLIADKKDVWYINKFRGSNSSPAEPPQDLLWGVELGYQTLWADAGQNPPVTDVSDPNYPTFFSEYDEVRGIPYNQEEDRWYDYFRIRYYEAETDPTDPQGVYWDYYYGVGKTGRREWSDTLLLTGSIPFATEAQIGGFLNVDEQYLDQGYVYLDSNGNLKLLDYDLLRSGTLAYQLGTSVNVPVNDDFTELQNYLDEYINNRVAFPADLGHDQYASIIDVYITVPKAEPDKRGKLEIKGIDSRFNTAVRINILGEAESNVDINIIDCQKIIINPTIYGLPVINIFRSSLYYDPTVMQYIKTCYRDPNYYQTEVNGFTGFRDLKLWYEKLSSTDPNLVVNDMTVSELDSPVISTTIDYWKELGSAINDNYYMVALRSITFSGAGDVTGIGVLVANNSTDNIDPGDKIVIGEFKLPQGANLIYPTACMSRKLKVTGTFTTAYASDDVWYVTDTSFTLKTNPYPEIADALTTGTAAFHSTTTLVASTISQTSVAPWEPGSYNIFEGGAIS